MSKPKQTVRCHGRPKKLEDNTYSKELVKCDGTLTLKDNLRDRLIYYCSLCHTQWYWDKQDEYWFLRFRQPYHSIDEPPFEE